MAGSLALVVALGGVLSVLFFRHRPAEPGLESRLQGTWTATDSKGKPVTLTISNVSGYRATVRFTSADTGLQTGRVLINTNNVFRIGDSQMQLTGTGKMTISTVITDATTGNQSIETDHATLKS